MTKKIVIISSGQPSANPRLLKEAIALHKSGFKIVVIYCPLSPWADEYDKKIFSLYSEIEWVKVGYHPVYKKWENRIARIRQKFFYFLYTILGNRYDAAIKSLVLFSQELIYVAKRQNADLYIGHNLGALPAVVIAAKYNNAKAAFDFEDFHRGEAPEESLHWKKTKLIEEKYVPFLSFATTASPLITKEYKKILPELSIQTINNCFPLDYVITEISLLPKLPLKLFWFSQTIGQYRGLETVIEAMGKMESGKVELSLLGNCTIGMKNYLYSVAKNNGLDVKCLIFLQPVEEKEIVAIASQHHIGLACEMPYVLNRDLCLTNKVFLYLPAGNAVVFSDTCAQALFLYEYPGIGVVYKQNDAEQLALLLKNYINDPALLHQHRTASLKLSKHHMNWETEQKVLLQKIAEFLK